MSLFVYFYLCSFARLVLNVCVDIKHKLDKAALNPEVAQGIFPFCILYFCILHFRIVTLRDTMIQSYLVEKKMSIPMDLNSLSISSTLEDVFIHMFYLMSEK